MCIHFLILWHVLLFALVLRPGGGIDVVILGALCDQQGHLGSDKVCEEGSPSDPSLPVAFALSRSEKKRQCLKTKD